jgi:cell division protein ZipA
MNGAELRWMLLLLGVLFIAGLAWWELRRPRQARGAELARADDDGAVIVPSPASAEAHGGRRAVREPTFTLPAIAARDPLLELPTIELIDDSTDTFTADRDEPIDLLADEVEPIVLQPAVADADPLLDPPAARSVGRPAEKVVEPISKGAAMEPIIEWPEEGERRIVAVRLVAGSERFPGHVVRQALAAEGFVLGKLAIFHRAGPDGRAVLSAANLMRPGTFDPESIDRQRFGGLSLFAVLPGPLPPVLAFDELLAAALNLNERLHGLLQDERGEALTPVRVAELREGLEVRSPHDG